MDLTEVEMGQSDQKKSPRPSTGDEERGVTQWVRRVRPQQIAALIGLVFVLLLLDEFSGITKPFERLSYLLDRGIARAVVYLVSIFGFTAALLLLVRARSRIVSVGTTAVLCVGTMAELGFNVFTERGFGEDYVAITLRELSMVPQAVTTYADQRVLIFLVVSIVAWVVILRFARRRSLFGPLAPTSLAVLTLAGLLVFSAAWRLRIDHFRHYPLFARPVLNVTDYYVQQRFIPKRLVPDVRLVDGPVPAERIVLMVDEAVRPDFLGLNGYGGDSSPYLDSIQSRLLNFGTAVSSATCSHNANLMLNSFVRPEDVSDRERVLSRPTIFHYAKQAGFRTVLLSAVFRSPLFYGIRKSDLQDIDEIVMINQLYDGDKHLNDHRLVAELDEIFEQYPDERLFVYVRKQGTHFPFDEYYPDTERPFMPVLGSARPMHEYKYRLLNSYLNGIRWNVDSFYRVLDETLSDAEALFFFTSDHGENVELDPEQVLHCGAQATMAMVPLWLDVRGEETRARFFESFGTDFVDQNRDHAAHMNIFPTLLRLMGIETAEPTLFDDLSGSSRDYYVGAGRGTYLPIRFQEPRLTAVERE